MEAHVETERHWRDVHRSKAPESTSWFERSPATSVRLIESLGLPADAAIVDVGGGASRLAGELLERGYGDITVTDIASEALERARAELGERAGAITWVVGDIRERNLGREFDLWHDRALFHFQVAPADARAYIESLHRGVAPGGHAVIATFGPAGPTSCSGLPVHRYGPAELESELGEAFELAGSELVTHLTPGGNEQQFMYAVLRRR